MSFSFSNIVKKGMQGLGYGSPGPSTALTAKTRGIMGATKRKALDGSLEELIEDMKDEDVTEALVNKGVLDLSEQAIVNTIEKRRRKIPKLMSILQEKDDEAFEVFLQTLKETKYPPESMEKLEMRANEIDVQVPYTPSIDGVLETRRLSEETEEEDGNTMRKDDGKHKMRECVIGTKKVALQEKVILLVGKTGDGKTTVINRMVNYLLRVKSYDKFRYELPLDPDEQESSTSSESQTKWISCYKICHREGFKAPAHFTFVDTPGFFDTENVTKEGRDKEITAQVKAFFSPGGYVDHVNAVVFVVKATENRLTKSQIELFESFSNLFGKDLAKNLFIFTTHSQLANADPPVIKLLREKKLEFEDFFPFNNVTFGSPDSSRMWEHSDETLENFFRRAMKSEPQSLFLSHAVMQEREDLKVYLANIPPIITSILVEVTNMQALEVAVKMNEERIRNNENFEYDETVEKSAKVETNSRALVCHRCSNNCHDPCDHLFVETCSAMRFISVIGGCKVCNCGWSFHEQGNNRYVKSITKVKKTHEQSKREHDMALGKKDEFEQLIDDAEKKTGKALETLHSHFDKVKSSLSRLQEIAYSPNTQSFQEYIEGIIQKEKELQGPGYVERVEQLEAISLRKE